ENQCQSQRERRVPTSDEYCGERLDLPVAQRIPGRIESPHVRQGMTQLYRLEAHRMAPPSGGSELEGSRARRPGAVIRSVRSACCTTNSTLSRSMSKRSMPARQQTPVRCDLHAPISTCAWIVARARGARSLPRGQLSAMLPNAPCELAGRSCDETEVAGQDCRDLPAYRLAPSPFLPAPDVVRHAPA